jgi:rod shape determining protein RodA
MSNFSNRIDFISVLFYITLVIIGVLAIYSSSYSPSLNGEFASSAIAKKQIIWIGVCFVLIILIIYTNVSAFNLGAYAMYGFVILLLVIVLLFGTTVAGSKSWFDFFGVRFQPAELAKYTTALALAKFLSRENNMLRDYKNVIMASGIILLPLVFILLQNDTGSALVFFSFILVFYREGLPGFWLLIAVWFVLLFVLTFLIGSLPLSVGITLIGISLIVIVNNKKKMMLPLIGATLISIVFIFSVKLGFEHLLQDHQKNRILVTMGLLEDNRGVGYNVRQSQIAIGAGQVNGRGFLKGTQTKLGFVPEQSTDFIFCTIAEETGFLGSVGFLLLYFGFLARLVFLAERQHSIFSRVFGYGVVSILFFHAVINIGMTMKIIPVIGIPLPFISYGGSSLLGFTLLVFTFLRLDANRAFEINRARG